MSSGYSAADPGWTKTNIIPIERAEAFVRTSLPNPSHESDNGGMSAIPTREELIARIEANEARSDARYLAFEKRVDDTMAGVHIEMTGINARLDSLKGEISSTKSTVLWMAALIVGTVVATAALVVTSFDSGRDTANMVSAAERRIDATVSDAVERIEAAVARSEANHSSATP